MFHHASVIREHVNSSFGRAGSVFWSSLCIIFAICRWSWKGGNRVNNSYKNTMIRSLRKHSNIIPELSFQTPTHPLVMIDWSHSEAQEPSMELRTLSANQYSCWTLIWSRQNSQSQRAIHGDHWKLVHSPIKHTSIVNSCGRWGLTPFKSPWNIGPNGWACK